MSLVTVAHCVVMDGNGPLYAKAPKCVDMERLDVIKGGWRADSGRSLFVWEPDEA